MSTVIFYIFRWNETNKTYFMSNVFFSAVICGVTCWISKTGVFETYGATKACLFAVLMASIWSGLFNTITRFYSESKYAVDELQKLIPISAYMIANLVIQIALCIVEALIVTYIFWELRFYYGVSQNGLLWSDHVNIEYFISFFLIIFSADMLGFCVGIAVKRINSLMTIVPFLLILQFLFSGCLFDLNGATQWISNIATAKFGFSVLGIETNINELAVYEALKDEAFAYTTGNLTKCWLNLGVLSLLLFLIAWIFLGLRVHETES